RRCCQGTGDPATQDRLEEQTAVGPDEAALWEREYEARLLARAVEQVRGDFHDNTWQAFWQTAMEGRKAAEAATALGMSVAAVYMAKSRVTARLKQRIQQLEAS